MWITTPTTGSGQPSQLASPTHKCEPSSAPAYTHTIAPFSDSFGVAIGVVLVLVVGFGGSIGVVWGVAYLCVEYGALYTWLAIILLLISLLLLYNAARVLWLKRRSRGAEIAETYVSLGSTRADVGIDIGGGGPCLQDDLPSYAGLAVGDQPPQAGKV